MPAPQKPCNFYRKDFYQILNIAFQGIKLSETPCIMWKSMSFCKKKSYKFSKKLVFIGLISLQKTLQVDNTHQILNKETLTPKKSFL